MVKVASVFLATGTALDIRLGIDRPRLPSDGARLMKRAWLGRRTVGPEALGSRIARRENMMTAMVVEGGTGMALVRRKRSYATRALHRWSVEF